MKIGIAVFITHGLSLCEKEISEPILQLIWLLCYVLNIPMFKARVLEKATTLSANALIFGLVNFVTSHAKSDARKITQFDKLRGQAETKVLSEIGVRAILLPKVKTSKSVDKVGG